MSDETNKNAILAKLRLCRDAVRQVLLLDWDPIGIKDEAEAQDEYDTYVDRVCAMLMHREGPEAIASYLWWAESEDMGMLGNRQHTDTIAHRLTRVYDEIEADSHERPRRLSAAGSLLLRSEFLSLA